jgi:hypothetical protein
MSLIQRKPRPLNRETSDYRDDRLFIVACDDTYAPQQYFSFFKIPRVHIHVVPTRDNSSVAEYVLGRLLKIKHEEDQRNSLSSEISRRSLFSSGKIRCNSCQRGYSRDKYKPCLSTMESHCR